MEPGVTRRHLKSEDIPGSVAACSTPCLCREENQYRPPGDLVEALLGKKTKSTV